MEDLKPGDPIPAEDKERVNMITQQIIAPAIQRAMEDARTKAPIHEVLSATANAYAAVLSELVGRPAAAKLMAAHADHLQKLVNSADT
jgi:hypothetical protein